jgi:hypothetical protein
VSTPAGSPRVPGILGDKNSPVGKGLPAQTSLEDHFNSDVDTHPGAQHHSLGLSPNQAAPGNILSKLVAGTNITLTKISRGRVQIDSSGGGGGFNGNVYDNSYANNNQTLMHTGSGSFTPIINDGSGGAPVENIGVYTSATTWKANVSGIYQVQILLTCYPDLSTAGAPDGDFISVSLNRYSDIILCKLGNNGVIDSQDYASCIMYCASSDTISLNGYFQLTTVPTNCQVGFTVRKIN